MGLNSDTNAVDYKYPSYVFSLVDEWGSGYSILVQGYGNQGDDQRMRDLLSHLDSEGRVQWYSCRKINRSEEASEEFPQTPIPPV